MPSLSIHTLGVDIAIASFVVAVFLYLRSRSKNRVPLPPSPPGYPIIGHYGIVPEKDPWVAYKKWGDELGSDIISVDMVGTPMIVINSLEIAKEIFERRSNIYSDRHAMPMMTEIGWRFALTFQPYTDDWKNHRKMFKQLITTSNVQDHVVDAVHEMIHKLANKPSDWESALRHMAGHVIFSTAYGIDIQPEHDPFVDLAAHALHSLDTAGVFGTYMVDFLPSLKRIPAWFPGGGFKKTIDKWAPSVKAMPEKPYEVTKAKMLEGSLKPSMALTALEELQGDDSPEAAEKERILKNVLGVVYAAGADTTVSSLSSFLLAMVQNPEIFQKGQAQVDEVVGYNRLPDLSDKESLPYVQAIVQEALRWQPVLPLGVPHAATSDDIYNGYRIPKGSIVMGNTWAILRDESIFGANTDKFDPERFLDKDGNLNPSVPHPDSAFGYGRRSCAGKDIALSTVWLAIATALATLEVTKAKDNKGTPIEPSGKYTSGMLIYPEAFPCEIHFRTKKAEGLVTSEL